MTRTFDASHTFADLAHTALKDVQLRANLARATRTIRDKRARVASELQDWEQLRDAGASIKDYVLDHLDDLIVELERNVQRNGGIVHWARTAAEANDIVVNLVKATGATSVIKVKSMVTQEIGLNVALEDNGIAAYETDLAELIVQLGDDLPSHILVPAIHKNRSQIQRIFLDEMGKSGLAAPDGLSDEPVELATAARAHLRERFFSARVGISGANFVLADSGSLVIVESEGNGRMCLTLPETLISVVGIEKILPDWESLGVFLQLLPRSATGERMNPYTSVFSRVVSHDGPSSFHLVLLDNGRTATLADVDGRSVLRCIRCSACLNVCPVYERTGGHSYGNTYPGPIGAVLVPQLRRGSRGVLENSLPFASTLCGACLEVCPVKIDIPSILVHLRTEIVDTKRDEHPFDPELVMMKGLAAVFSSQRRFTHLVGLGRLLGKAKVLMKIRHLPPPLSGWVHGRDLPSLPTGSFRDWFNQAHATSTPSSAPAPDTAVATLRQVSVTDVKEVELDNARDSILDAIRSTKRSRTMAEESEMARQYRSVGQLSLDQRIVRFQERLVDYRANVQETTEQELGSALESVLTTRGVTSVILPSDAPPFWSSDISCQVRVDSPPLSIDELDRMDATISGCAIAIAETGTIVLDAGAHQGRRALSLIPDHLVIIVYEDQIVEVVPEAIARLDATTPQTWISGPSATSDIELERVEGVHGPRVLDVLVVRNNEL